MSYDLALLDAKLALEDELRKPLAALVMRYIYDLQTGTSRGIFTRNAVAATLRDVLEQHYARVTMVVTGRRPKRPQPLPEAAFNTAHLERMQRRASAHSLLILSSIDNLWASTPDTKAESVYQRYLGKAREVWRKAKAKLKAILATETNPVAEDARLEEAKRIAGNRPFYKWWSSMLDERVRDWHEEAEAQERLASEPFEVGGEALMFPGDGSNGASLRNIINCRCSAVYFLRGPNGEREEISSTPRLTPVKPNRSVGSVDHPSLITSQTRLTEGAINRVFLRDLLEARVAIRGGRLTVTRGGRNLAEARYSHTIRGGSKIEGLVIRPGNEGLGIRELLERSLGKPIN